MEQSEYSPATDVLKLAAICHPKEVLNALIPKLANPYSPPYMIQGAITKILEVADISVFTKWLKKQKSRVVLTIAGNLPRPYLDDEGRAQVPPLTRAFWDDFPPTSARFKKLYAEFRSQTFNTGVYWGHGIELFNARVKIGRQLGNDPNPAIRFWAAGFEKESEDLLKDAIRSSELDAESYDIKM